MFFTSKLSAVRKLRCTLDALPDTIVVPALGVLRREPLVKRLEEATLDDIAFAVRGIEAEFNTVADRLHALRKLYGLAREAGALGAECAVDVVSRDAGGR